MAVNIKERGITPSLLDRLFDDNPAVQRESLADRYFSISQLKRSVARDLEALLNTRCSLDAEHSEAFPRLSCSVASYGLTDFVGASLHNPDDRDLICEALERAIQTHEKRLKNVRIALEGPADFRNGLRFRVSAILEVEPAREPVNFDAMLQPGAQHYVINGLG